MHVGAVLSSPRMPTARTANVRVCEHAMLSRDSGATSTLQLRKQLNACVYAASRRVCLVIECRGFQLRDVSRAFFMGTVQGILQVLLLDVALSFFLGLPAQWYSTVK